MMTPSANGAQVLNILSVRSYVSGWIYTGSQINIKLYLAATNYIKSKCKWQ